VREAIGSLSFSRLSERLVHVRRDEPVVRLSPVIANTRRQLVARRPSFEERLGRDELIRELSSSRLSSSSTSI
jgi:hypothetical protein